MKKAKVLANLFDTIPDVEVQRIGQFLPIVSVCNFRLACKRFLKAAPFMRVSKDTTTNQLTPITVALAIDATEMDEDTLTNALILDNAHALTTIVLSFTEFEYPAVKLFSQCLNGTTNGNNISLYVRRHYPQYEPIVHALMNHPRITRVDGVRKMGLYNSFWRYKGSWSQVKPFAGGPFDDRLWGSPTLECFCDVHEVMHLPDSPDWIDIFGRGDNLALKNEFDKIRRARFASMLEAMGESVDSEESTRSLYARLYMLTYGTILEEDLQQEDTHYWPPYDSDVESDYEG